MNHKIALVTGVSRLKGIGRAICCELARKGFDIFFTYWTAYDNQMPWKVQPNEPAFIQQEVRDFGVRCEKLELDLTSEHAVEQLLAEVKQQLGPPLVLINNATYSTATSIEGLNAQELDRHYAVNLKATTLLILAFIRQFPFTEHGRIINLSSGQSLEPMPNEIAYVMTKGAIETLTYTLSQEIASRGITINAVNPGPNDTGWMPEALKTKLVQQFPMGRLGMPQDAAKLIGFLASEDASWVTGQIIHSEGGFRRQ